eukprot:Sdes_comp24078_c0_seq1m22140
MTAVVESRVMDNSCKEDSEEVAVSNEIVTVFDDPEKFNVKHPLQNKWTFWYDLQERKATDDNWGQGMREVYSFDTVEDFWAIYNNILPASALPLGASYFLFKSGIHPSWEDPKNANGGRFFYAFPKNEVKGKDRKDTLNDLWLDILLALIGETLDDDDEACGVVLAIRKFQEKFAIWTSDHQSEAQIKKMRANLLECLPLIEANSLSYAPHKDPKPARSR